VFPYYELSRGPVTGVFSPPPDLKISYQGPLLLNQEKLKQRKAERRHRRFVEGCLNRIENESAPKYSLVRTGVEYADPRPFHWNDYDVTPLYTYLVDLSVGADTLLDRFSSDARKNITNTPDDAYEIREGGVEEARRIIRQVKARHAEQGEPYEVSPDFAADLYRALPDGAVRPYVCTLDGQFAGGMLALDSGDTVYRWQGGAKTDTDVPVNDLIDWHIIRDAIDNGRQYYDLVGANTQRLCGYKAKFAPDVETYMWLQKSTRTMDVVADLYKRFRRV
jgi:hypothetical protein